MNKFIDLLTANPVILIVAVLVSVIIVLSFAKRIIRFLLVLLAIAVLYAAWVIWHGGDVKEKAGKAEQSVHGAVQKGDSLLKQFQGLFKHDDKTPGKEKE
jgi:FlaA1/EpsC-like NDP-sugar epimerase